MIFDIIKDAIEYTLNGNKVTVPLGILYTLSIFLIPLIFIEGYSYEIIQNSVHGIINIKEESPDLKIDNKRIINGIKLFLVKIIYAIPLLLLNYYAVFYLEPGSEHYIIILLSLILIVLTLFFDTIASAHMIKEESFIKAFDFKKIYQIIKSIGIKFYIEIFLSIMVVVSGVFVVGLFLITIISIILSGILFLIGIKSLFGISITLITLIILLYIGFSFIVLPYYTLFKNRIIATIYNLQ